MKTSNLKTPQNVYQPPCAEGWGYKVENTKHGYSTVCLSIGLKIFWKNDWDPEITNDTLWDKEIKEYIREAIDAVEKNNGYRLFWKSINDLNVPIFWTNYTPYWIWMVVRSWWDNLSQARVKFWGSLETLTLNREEIHCSCKLLLRQSSWWFADCCPRHFASLSVNLPLPLAPKDATALKWPLFLPPG